MDSPGGLPVAGLAITSPGPDEVPSSRSASPVSLDDRSRSRELAEFTLQDDAADHRSSTQPFAYGAHGEQRTIATNHNFNISQQRSQYFEDAFAYKDTGRSARERIQRDTPIIAELRTNVIVCSTLVGSTP